MSTCPLIHLSISPVSGSTSCKLSLYVLFYLMYLVTLFQILTAHFPCYTVTAQPHASHMPSRMSLTRCVTVTRHAWEKYRYNSNCGVGRRQLYSKLRPDQNVTSEIALTQGIFLSTPRKKLWILKLDIQAVLRAR